MFTWLQSLDTWLFRLINLSLSNSFFDKIMPPISNTPFFGPAVAVILLLLIWKGGAKGRICALMLVLAVVLGDSGICNTLKHAVGRLRPFNDIPDAHVLVGRSGSGSMPSSHAANWFAATMICFIFYRRSIRFMLPLAILVSFSRIYNGVHYPSDVIAGAILGAGYGAAGVIALNALWRFIGQRCFPLWWQRFPSLLTPKVLAPQPEQVSTVSMDQHWLRLGYVVTALLLLARFFYIGSGRIELSEDEAYQWIWSKHLALSYFSKPPLIAYTQFLGTHLWGDTAFGIRFFSPVISAVMSVLLLRFLGQLISGRAAFVFLLIVTATPLMALGSTLMTIDPLSVLFWTGAMIVGWKAVQPEGTTRQWLWVGLWMGLGFLSKYTNLAQLVSLAVFFVLWPPARKHLRRPGPYLALLILLISSLPVLVWNAQHAWITVDHLKDNGNLRGGWHPTLSHFFEFLGAEFGVMNPVFFIGAIWAAIAFWRKDRRNPLRLYFFSMGAPLFLGYLVLSLHTTVQPNWIAPSILPLFCLMALYWSSRWEQGRWIRRYLTGGILLGLFVVVLTHETDLIGKMVHRTLPPRLDLLHRVRGWSYMANVVGDAQKKLEAEGTPAFILCEHYGFTAEITFYLPEAKERVLADPLVYCRASGFPENQFYFFPGYQNRKGQNAIFVRETARPSFCKDWFRKWVDGRNDLYTDEVPDNPPLPPVVQRHFDSIRYLGLQQVLWAGDRVVRQVQMFECRNFH